MLVKQLNAEVARRAYPFPLPPPGFDPLSASAKQLDEYGLPPRPDPAAEPDMFLFWGLLLSPPITFIVPDLQAPDEPATFRLRGLVAGARQRVVAPVISGRGRQAGSRNWSGAYLTPRPPSRFVRIVGGWRVPAPSVPAILPAGADRDHGEYRSSTWIGLDGLRPYPGSSLPQIGTSQFIKVANGRTTVTTSAWWQWWVRDHEFPPIDIRNLPVAVGDEVLVSLTVRADDEVLFHIKNQSSGLFASILVTAPAAVRPPGTTAEWIMERPTELQSSRLFPLPNCTDVLFRHCVAKSVGGATATTHNLDAARLVRMYEPFEAPHRKAFVSHPKKLTGTSARVSYREAGT